MPELIDGNLRLRIGQKTSPTEADLERMHAAYQIEHEDPDFPFDRYRTEILHQYYCGERGDIFGHYNITSAESEVVGHISFFARPIPAEALAVMPVEVSRGRSSVEAEIGWAICKTRRSHGYATRGATRVLQFAFDDLNLDRVVAITRSSNAPSLRVMEKLRMTLYPFAESKVIGIAGPSA